MGRRLTNNTVAEALEELAPAKAAGAARRLRIPGAAWFEGLTMMTLMGALRPHRSAVTALRLHGEAEADRAEPVAIDHRYAGK